VLIGDSRKLAQEVIKTDQKINPRQNPAIFRKFCLKVRIIDDSLTEAIFMAKRYKI
jgi:hypothetical protein